MEKKLVYKQYIINKINKKNIIWEERCYVLNTATSPNLW